MGAVIRVYRDLNRTDGGTLGLVNHSSHVETVFGMTGFEKLLQPFANEESAIEALA
jgi:anti-anti-sigma regulatory factor